MDSQRRIQAPTESAAYAVPGRRDARPTSLARCPHPLADLCQRVVEQRNAFQVLQLLQPLPAASDEAFLLADEGGIELALVEIATGGDRLKIGVGDELSERGIAADVALASRMKRLGIDLADHVAEIEIALPDVLDIAAADV